jgi:hypothetical protein
MRSRFKDHSTDRPSGWRLGFASGFAAFAMLLIGAAYVGSLIIHAHMAEIGPPRVAGTPLRVAAPDGDAVFVMTSQKETRIVGGAGRWSTYRGFETVVHFDLWRFDAAALRPVWRKRLLTDARPNLSKVGVLGADGDRVWLFLGGPVVASTASGEVVGGAAAIEDRNPALKNVVPLDEGHYRFFHGYGLVFTAADARAWRVDAATLEATPWDAKTAVKRPSAIGLPHYAPSSLTTFQKRGLTLEQNWLGVLTEDEGEAMNRGPQVPGARPGERRRAMAEFLDYTHAPPELSHGGPKRYRLWRSKVEHVSAAPAGWPKTLPDRWGKRPRYSAFAPFEKSPEFLQAGLLSDGRSRLPILLRDPDSVLVLHRDRIDDEGRLHVTRIAGPDGRTVWDAASPLSVLQSVMPGAGPLVLFGRAYVAPNRDMGDPYHDAHEWLISLDLATGSARTFDLSAAETAVTRSGESRNPGPNTSH